MTTLYSYHIEQPAKAFTVRVEVGSYWNVFWHEATTEVFRVLAETADGALRVAKYHFPMRGRSFELA